MLQQGTRRASGHGQQFGRILLQRSTALQHPVQIVLAQPQETNQLTAGTDGAQQALRCRRKQNQQPMAGFLQGLQQRIGRGLGHGFDRLDHHHAPRCLHRLSCQEAADRTHLLQTQLRWRTAADARLLGFLPREQTPLMLKRRLDPEQIWMVACLQPPALPLRGLPRPEHAFQKPQGGKPPTDTVRPGKQISRCQLLPVQAGRQQIHCQRLTDQVVEQGRHPSRSISSFSKARLTASGGRSAAMADHPRCSAMTAKPSITRCKNS